MKKIIVVTAFLLLTISLFASNPSEYTAGMTSAQKERFYMDALSVVPKNVSISTGFGSAYTNQYGYTFGSATSRTTDYLDWDAYLGSTQISRAYFYKLTNQNGLYNSLIQSQERVQKKHKTGTYLTIGGSALFGVGMGVMLFGGGRSNPYDMFREKEAYDNYQKKSDSMLWWGAGIALASTIPLAFGIVDLMYNEKDNVSVSFAMGIADVYNEALAARIKLSY